MRKVLISIVAMIILSVIGGTNLANKARNEATKTIVQEENEKVESEDEQRADNNFEKIEIEESNTETEVVSESSSNSIDNKISSSSNNFNKQVTKQEVTYSNISRSQTENCKEEVIEEPTIQETPKEENKSDVTTAFYNSITGGKKEFSSESACRARGTQIQDNELNYVLDYNEQHPETPIQPDINYFRCYPVIDEQGEGWYLHFFCKSGEGNDEKLKSMY